MELFKKSEPKPHEPGQPWTLAEAAERLRVSESLLRKAKKNGTLRTISFGRRVMIADEEMARVATFGLVAPGRMPIDSQAVTTLRHARSASRADV